MPMMCPITTPICPSSCTHDLCDTAEILRYHDLLGREYGVFLSRGGHHVPLMNPPLESADRGPPKYVVGWELASHPTPSHPDLSAYYLPTLPIQDIACFCFSLSLFLPSTPYHSHRQVPPPSRAESLMTFSLEQQQQHLEGVLRWEVPGRSLNARVPHDIGIESSR